MYRPVHFALLVQLYLFQAIPTISAERITPIASRRMTTPINNNNQEAAVLRELKEVVQSQLTEIGRLKKELASQKQSSSSASTHHHGGPPSPLDGYLQKRFIQIALERVGWLSLFLVSLSLTALIMNGFEHTLSSQIELAYFVPLLAGHGGNTGGQTVGTVLSALSSGSVQLRDAPRVISKEAMSGLTIGLVLGSLVGNFAHFGMGISRHVATVVGCTMPLVSTIAATLGSAIPFGCLALGLNPSVIAAPAMTSFVDVLGLMSYFLIANQIFALYGMKL